jgi:hypothetical protein
MTGWTWMACSCCMSRDAIAAAGASAALAASAVGAQQGRPGAASAVEAQGQRVQAAVASSTRRLGWRNLREFESVSG